MKRYTILFSLLMTCKSLLAQNFYTIISDTATYASPAVLKCTDGGFLAYGFKYHPNGNFPAGWISKLDSSGSMLWQKNFLTDERLIWAEETSTGGFYIVSFHNDTDVVVKTDPHGDVIWKKEYKFLNGNSRDPLGIKRCANDELFIIEEISVAGSIFDAGIFKIDSSGNMLWHKSASRGQLFTDYFYTLRISPDSNIYLLGQTGHVSVSNSTITKLDLDGNFKWQRSIEQRYLDIAVLSNAEILVTGTDRTAPFSKGTIALFKMDSASNFINGWHYESPAYSLQALGVVAIDSHTFQVSGNAIDTNNFNLIYPLMLTVNDSGAILRSVIYLDTSLKSPAYYSNQSGTPDLFATIRTINGVNQAVVIHDSDGTGICNVTSIPIDTVTAPFYIYGPATYGETNTTVSQVNGICLTYESGYAQDGCHLTNVIHSENPSSHPRIFPNPFNTHIEIILPDDDQYLLTIYDLAGRKYFTSKINRHQIVDFTTLPDGMYLYDIHNGNHSFKNRIVKQE